MITILRCTIYRRRVINNSAIGPTRVAIDIGYENSVRHKSLMLTSRICRRMNRPHCYYCCDYLATVDQRTLHGILETLETLKFFHTKIYWEGVF